MFCLGDRGNYRSLKGGDIISFVIMNFYYLVGFKDKTSQLFFNSVSLELGD